MENTYQVRALTFYGMAGKRANNYLVVAFTKPEAIAFFKCLYPQKKILSTTKIKSK